MESIIIVIIGLIFTVLSKGAKDRQAIEKEKEKRKEQLRGRRHHTTISGDTEGKARSNNRSLRDIFMEELNKLEGDEGGLGDLLKNSFNTEDENEEGTRASQVNYYNESDYVSEEEYLENEGYRHKNDQITESYIKESSIEDNDKFIQDEITNSRKKSKSIGDEGVKRPIKNNRQYNPFTKSLNRKDIIRGIIFSEVLDKPKSLRNEKRSM